MKKTNPTASIVMLNLDNKLRAILRVRKWRIILLTILLVLALPQVLFNPVRTVKGMVQSTGLRVGSGLTIDAGRVAFLCGGVPTCDGSSVNQTVVIFDTVSGSSTSFPVPVPPLITDTGNFVFTPQIYGDKIVMGWARNSTLPTSIYYCVLPHKVLLQPCGPWQLIAGAFNQTISGVSGIGCCAFSHDLVVWVNATSGFFYYYRFSSGTVVSVAAPTRLGGFSTNGAIIAFSAKPSVQASSQTIMYYDITASSPTIVNTGLPSFGFVSLSPENIIAFESNSTAPVCSPNPLFCRFEVRYYDILRDQASPAGTGPTGTGTIGGSPISIWGARIVFNVRENYLGVDCDGGGTITTNPCIRYWNIRNPGWVAPLLVPQAAPGGGGGVIYGNTVAFEGSDLALRFMTVPMKGDLNQDGLVDIVDLVITASCFGKTLSGSTC